MFPSKGGSERLIVAERRVNPGGNFRVQIRRGIEPHTALLYIPPPCISNLLKMGLISAAGEVVECW